MDRETLGAKVRIATDMIAMAQEEIEANIYRREGVDGHLRNRMEMVVSTLYGVCGFLNSITQEASV